MHAADAGRSSTPRPPGIPPSASPSSSSRTNRRTRPGCRSGTQNRWASSRTLRVDLPVGLSVNPQATPQCELASFEAEQCAVSAPGSQVGTSAVTAALAGLPAVPLDGPTKVPVYNLVPKQGQPALFGFTSHPLQRRERLPRSRRRLGRRLPRGVHDRGAEIAARRDPAKPAGLQRPRRQRHLPHPAEHLLRPRPGRLRARLLDPAAGRLRRAAQPDLPQRLAPSSRRRCRRGSSRPAATKSPSSRRSPSTPAPSRPTRPAARWSRSKVPFERSGTAIANSRRAGRASSRCRAAWASTPPPPRACRRLHRRPVRQGHPQPGRLPGGSKIGTVSIETPPLPAGSLTGNVFLGQQLSRDPRIGQRLPDLPQRRVGPLRGRRPPGRQRQRQRR